MLRHKVLYWGSSQDSKFLKKAIFFLKNTIHNSANIGIGIGSVSADLKKRISVIYRIGRFRKWHLSVYIGIGRYEKNLIGRTLLLLIH